MPLLYLKVSLSWSVESWLSHRTGLVGSCSSRTMGVPRKCGEQSQRVYHCSWMATPSLPFSIPCWLDQPPCSDFLLCLGLKHRYFFLTWEGISSLPLLELTTALDLVSGSLLCSTLSGTAEMHPSLSTPLTSPWALGPRTEPCPFPDRLETVWKFQKMCLTRPRQNLRPAVFPRWWALSSLSGATGKNGVEGGHTSPWAA